MLIKHPGGNGKAAHDFYFGAGQVTSGVMLEMDWPSAGILNNDLLKRNSNPQFMTRHSGL